MKIEKKIKRIKCPIFVAKNETIEKINKAINSAADIKLKVNLAKDLLRHVACLLSCEYFREKNRQCKICQTISLARKEMAKLIIKTRKSRQGNGLN